MTILQHPLGIFLDTSTWLMQLTIRKINSYKYEYKGYFGSSKLKWIMWFVNTFLKRMWLTLNAINFLKCYLSNGSTFLYLRGIKMCFQLGISLWSCLPEIYSKVVLQGALNLQQSSDFSGSCSNPVSKADSLASFSLGCRSAHILNFTSQTFRRGFTFFSVRIGWVCQSSGPGVYASVA